MREFNEMLLDSEFAEIARKVMLDTNQTEAMETIRLCQVGAWAEKYAIPALRLTANEDASGLYGGTASHDALIILSKLIGDKNANT